MESDIQPGYREKFVCRTCLKIVAGPSFKIQDICDKNETKISEVLGFIVPELYLGLTVNPEICLECKESVQTTYSFRKRCLETETIIGTYLKNAKCTARTIDLHDVLAYSAKTSQKDQQTVHNIISEWEDDSSRDNARDSENESVEEVEKKKDTQCDGSKKCFVPTCPVSIQNSEKLLISVPKSEEARRSWSAAVGLKIIPSAKSHSLFCCEDHFNMEEDAENWLKYRLMNVKLRMKKHVKPHLNLNRRVHDVKYSQSQLSPPSRSRRLESAKSSDLNANPIEKQPTKIAEDGISETIVVSDEENSTINMIHHRPFRNQGTPRYIKIMPNGRYFLTNRRGYRTKSGEEKEEVETEDRLSNLEELEETEHLKKITIPTGIDLGEQLTICEETGLFKNKEGKYFSDALKPMTKKDVEDLKAKAKTCDALYICEETGLLRNSKGEYFTEDGKPLGGREVEAEKEKAKIRGERLFQITDICTIEEMAERVDRAAENPAVSQEAVPKLQPSDKNLQKPSAAENEVTSSNPTASPAVRNKYVKILPKKPTPVGSFECMTESANVTVSSAPEYVQKLVESVGCKTQGSNLAVPPYLPIVSQKPPTVPPVESVVRKYKKSRSMGSSSKSLLKPSSFVAPSQCTESSQPPSSSLIKLSDFVASVRPVDKNPKDGDPPVVVKKEPVEMEIEEGQIVFNYFPEDDDDEETLTASESASYHSLEGLLDSLEASESAQYVDVPEFVQINHFTLSDLENLKRQRRIPREAAGDRASRKDINLRALLATQPAMTSPKGLSTAVGRESSVGYRENFDVSPGLRVAESKPRRRRVKIAPVDEDQIVGDGENNNFNSHHPNREICVLFTNYSYDGLYINDHDYLVTPYKRNKIVSRENGQSFCMCFICGCKHKIEEHVLHMNSHKSKCDICNVNLGTGYMLNLHMRSHTKPCKFCTDLVPYPEIHEHAKKHLQEDLEFEKGKERKRKKRDDKDAKPVYFQLSPDIQGTSTSPRLRSRTSRLPSTGTDCMSKKLFQEMKVDIDKTETDRVDTRNVSANEAEINISNASDKTETCFETRTTNTNEGEANNSNASNRDKERIGNELTETNEDETNANTSDGGERRNKKGRHIKKVTADIKEDKTNTANESDVGERHLRKGRHTKKRRTGVNEDVTDPANTSDAEARQKRTTEMNESDGNSEWHIKKEAINVEAKQDETNNVETSNSDVEKGANEDETVNSNTSNMDARHVVKESTDSKISPLSNRKARKRKIETLSKEQCDLEEKLVKIDEKSKESKKRVLRSSFGKKTQGCSENEESASHNAKQEPPLR